MLLEGREEELPQGLGDQADTRLADTRLGHSLGRAVRRAGVHTRAQNELQEAEEVQLERPCRLRGEARLRPC